jgi:hypothetical protein
MPTISGENSTPLGRAGTGASYILGNTSPDPLRILLDGDRTRTLAAQRRAAAHLKADQENAKAFNDLVKFDQDGSPYFSEALSEKVYRPLMPELTGIFKQYKNDHYSRNEAVAPVMQRANNETKQSEAKTKYINDQLRTWQGDTKLYDTDYAGQKLSAARRKEDGSYRLPSEFDAEAWHDGLLGDHNLYKEGEVVRRATEKLAPVISQRVAEAGTIGGQHTADQVRGRFVAFDGKGHPILNADGSPKLNLTADTQTLLESDPLFKLKVDAREAAYNKQREADPNLPQMSRRGHIAQMVGPLAFYDARHDEGLNRLPPQPRSGSGGGDYDIPGEAPTFEGEGRYNLTTQAGDAPYFNAQRPVGGQRIGFETGPTPTRPDFATYGQPLPQPMFRKKSGQLAEIEVEGFTPPEVMQKGSDGIHRPTKYNGQTMSGKFGPAVPVFADLKGNVLPVQSRAEGEALVRQGKANLRLQFDFHQRTNKNYATDVKDLANKLLSDRDDATGHPKYHSFQEAEAVAQKRLSGGLERVPVLYTPRNQQVVDRAAGPLYRKQNEALMAEQRRLRAEGPSTPVTKAKADPLGFGDSQPASKARPKPDPLGFGDTGGLYTRPKRPSLLPNIKTR